MALIGFFDLAVLAHQPKPAFHGWAWFLSQAVLILALAVSLLVMLAFLLLFDRKVWAAVQMRRGPNVVGAFGLLQSFADFLKFVLQGSHHSGGSCQGACFCWRRWCPSRWRWRRGLWCRWVRAG